MIFLFTATFTILALSSLDQVDSSAYDTQVTHSRIKAKEEGPNVCALLQVMGTNKTYFSTCIYWNKKSICGKKAIILYECCPGYKKLDGKRGCPAVACFDSVYGTLDLVKARITQQYTNQSKLREELEGAGSYTMFAPSDDAWEELDPASKAAMVNRGNTELYNALHYHMVKKRLLTKDLKNDMTLVSMNNKKGLYINHYSNGVVTVNCARIIHGNRIATNGVVHVIDRVISATSQTIKDVLENNDELSTLNRVSVNSGLWNKLGEPGHYTLFAPTNKAFNKLNRNTLERLLRDRIVLKAILKYHLLNSVQCSEAIMAGSIYETLEGSNIKIGCDGESLTVNGIKMVLKKDIVTRNGVIHLISQVLMPDSAKQVMELLGKSGRIFGKMVSELGLSAETEYTLFAPLNRAFSDEVKSMDQHLLRIILENHILDFKVSLNELYNGQLLETLGGKLLRVFIYRTAVCIENACMIRGSREGSDGVVHFMRSLIQAPQMTVYELLLKEGRFKIFLSLMESAGLTDILKQEGSYTLFAPIDVTFAILTEQDIVLLKSDINALRAILLYHFCNGVFISGGLEGGVTNLLKTIQGNNLQVLFVNNSIHVNSEEVPDFDHMASNGVVHVMKTMLYPQDLPVGSEDILILLKKLIKYMQLKFESGFTCREIPLTFIKRTIATHVVEKGPVKVTREDEEKPSKTKVSKEDEGKHSKTKVSKEDKGKHSKTKVSKEDKEKHSKTKVSKEGEGKHSKTKVSKGDKGKHSKTKVSKEDKEKHSKTKVSKEGEGKHSKTKVSKEDNGKHSKTKVSKEDKEKHSKTKVSKEGEGKHSKTKVSKEDKGKHSKTKVSKEDKEKHSKTKVSKEGEGKHSKTKVSKDSKEDEGKHSKTKVSKEDKEKHSKTKVSKEGEGKHSKTKVSKDTKEDKEKHSKTKVSKEDEGKHSKTKVSKEDKEKHSKTKVSKEDKEKHSKTKVSKEDEGKHSKTKVSKEDEGKHSKTKVSIGDEGKHSKTKVSKEGEGKHSKTKVSIGDEGKHSKTKVSKEDEGKHRKNIFSIWDEGKHSKTKVSIGDEGKHSKTKVSKEGEGKHSKTKVSIGDEGKHSKTKVSKEDEGKHRKTIFSILDGGKHSKTKVSKEDEGKHSKTKVSKEDEGKHRKNIFSILDGGKHSKTKVSKEDEGKHSKTKVSKEDEGKHRKTIFSIWDGGKHSKTKVSKEDEGKHSKTKVSKEGEGKHSKTNVFKRG